jgi:hypothetical protein
MQQSEMTYQLEAQRPFAQSFLWELQRRYFAERGVDAWVQDEVPHYVTSNPMIAHSYARMIVACWRDYLRLAPQAAHERFYLCELGAGSGRFAFHLLQQLLDLCQELDLPALNWCYVLTDSSPALLECWRQHPRLQPFFSRGLLDIAIFDMERPAPLRLQISGATLETGQLCHPLIVIANYAFDSIVQDLFFLREGTCAQCLISLSLKQDPHSLTSTELLSNLEVAYACEPLTTAPYQEPLLNELLADYQGALRATHLLFPATGLRCLHYLSLFSPRGALVLSTDKGDHQLEALDYQPAPAPVRHGSFSLLVNYHAFRAFCERSGGQALLPTHYTSHITTGCFLLLDQQEAYTATRQAYQRFIENCGPDDFYTLSVHARRHQQSMTIAEILAYMRLSHYDSHLFAAYLPRLQQLAPGLDQEECQALSDLARRVWQGYFPLTSAEREGMAAQYACLLRLLGIDPCAFLACIS